MDPKTVVLVNMNKQTERKDPYEKKIDVNQEDLILNVNYDAIDPKPNVPNFEKQLPRKEIEIKEQDEIEVNPNYEVIKPTGPKISFPKEKKGTELKKDDPNDGKITTEQVIDMEKALASIKAKTPAVDFKSYAKRDNVKEEDKKKLIAQKLKEDQEKLKKNIKLNELEEEKGEVFQKYEGSPKLNKDKDNTINNKKPPKKPKDKITKPEEKKDDKFADIKLTKSEIAPWGKEKAENEDVE